MKVKKPRVYLDITIGNAGGGRVIFELFADITPRTAENFRGLCTGEYGKGQKTKKRLCYEGCTFFRSVSGFMVQSGDFQCDNGDGGESIYGGQFNDEDFTRRHTQAGVLSMANTGRNSNGSQFFVTLKRAPQLDGKHMAFGQVIEGMDVIRAVAAVPTDRDDKPRVAITIVGCGEVDKKVRSKANVHEQISRQIADLNEEVAPTGAKIPEATKAKAILSGKQGGAAIDEGNNASWMPLVQEEDTEEGGTGTAPARNERERKLFELRLRMNQGCRSNNKEVIEEQKRFSDPEYGKKKAQERIQRQQEDGKEVIGSQSLPSGKEYMLDTAENVELREAKKKRGNPEAFGWDVFNADSLYRAHEKRLKHLQFDEAAYTKQEKSELTSPMFGGFGHQPTEVQKDRLQASMDKMMMKKKEFSRRREHVAQEDVTYINERNRVFNKKMQRAFGDYTHEIRQNLERGTAL